MPSLPASCSPKGWWFETRLRSPFDTHTVELDIDVPGALTNCSAIAAHMNALPTNDIIPTGTSPWLMNEGVAGGTIQAASFVHENGAIVPSRCLVKIAIFRTSTVYIVSNLIPIMIIAFAALMVLHVNPATMPPRYSVLIFGMVLMSLKTNAGLGLGTLTYLIWVDYLRTLVFVLFLGAMICNIIIHRLMRENTDYSKTSAQRLDKLTRVIFPFVLYPILISGMLIVGFGHVTGGLIFGLVLLFLFLFLAFIVFRFFARERVVGKRRWAEYGLAMLETDLTLLSPEEQASETKKLDAFLNKGFIIFDDDKSKALDKPELLTLVTMLHMDTGESWFSNKGDKGYIETSKNKIKGESAVRAEVKAMGFDNTVDLKTFVYALKQRYHIPAQSGNINSVAATKDVEAGGKLGEKSAAKKELVPAAPLPPPTSVADTMGLAQAIAEAITAHQKKTMVVASSSTDDASMKKEALLVADEAEDKAGDVDDNVEA